LPIRTAIGSLQIEPRADCPPTACGETLLDLPIVAGSSFYAPRELEWDDRKAMPNEHRHGVTPELARLVFGDPNAWIGSISIESDEDRG
jgi:hypothetical protein